MIRLNSIFFLLFLLLITGGTAAMAQNIYGFTLMGASISLMALFCLLGGIMAFFDPKKNNILALESINLFVLFSIAAMRIFLIRIPYIELIFITAGGLLVALYLIQIARLYTFEKHNKSLLLTLTLFYASISVYAFSVTINPLSNYYSEIAGMLAFAILLLAAISTVRIKAIITNDKAVSLSKFLSIQPNRAILLCSLFLLFTVYSAGTLFKIIPDIQSSKMPAGFYILVREAEVGAEIPVDGKFRYQTYNEKMSKFLNNRGIEN